MGNKAKPDVLDSLSDRVEQDDFRGEGASGGDHGNGVDNRHGVE